MNTETELEVLPEYDYTGSSIGSVLGVLQNNEAASRFLLRIGRSRHRITEQNREGICKGLLMALELREERES